jgi:hypothetical protein
MEKADEAPGNLDPGGSTNIGLLISQRMLMNVGKRDLNKMGVM